MAIESEADLLHEAMGCIYYYDNVREHSALNYHTPFSYLKTQLPDIDDKIRFVIPIILDKVAVDLGHWGGYHVLAQNLVDWQNPVKLEVAEEAFSKYSIKVELIGIS